jgi:hypothetical protein
MGKREKERERGRGEKERERTILGGERERHGLALRTGTT